MLAVSTKSFHEVFFGFFCDRIDRIAVKRIRPPMRLNASASVLSRNLNTAGRSKKLPLLSAVIKIIAVYSPVTSWKSRWAVSPPPALLTICKYFTPSKAARLSDTNRDGATVTLYSVDS